MRHDGPAVPIVSVFHGVETHTLLTERDRGIDNSVGEVITGIRLKENIRTIPTLSEFLGECFGAPVAVTEGIEEPELPLEHRGGTGEATHREARCDDGAVRRPSAMEGLDVAATAVGFDDSGPHAARNRQRVHGSFSVQVLDTRTRNSRRNCAKNRRRVEAMLEEDGITQRRIVLGHGEACEDLVAGCQSHYDGRSVRTGLLRLCQDRRHKTRTRVRHRGKVRVIEIQSVRRCSVDECSGGGWDSDDATQPQLLVADRPGHRRSIAR